MPLILRVQVFIGLPKMSSVLGALEGDGSSRSSPGPSLSDFLGGGNGDGGVAGDDNVDAELGEEGSAVDASSKYAARSSVRSAVAAGAGSEKTGRLIRLYERGVFLEP
ncbi:hypothetical protein O1611_g8584 [Lasiodiplodia mahajangana]|uniref:Uncharacterized protein n=1 Tax=Lasiodiplodia mahajangana TaxID=1108764 RepID=A0ACC2JCA6_9PEZI|nr:hypothetical protein O1611_g8584 [Lasiodiplodia mahajangana]